MKKSVEKKKPKKQHKIYLADGGCEGFQLKKNPGRIEVFFNMDHSGSPTLRLSFPACMESAFHEASFKAKL